VLKPGLELVDQHARDRAGELVAGAAGEPARLRPPVDARVLLGQLRDQLADPPLLLGGRLISGGIVPLSGSTSSGISSAGVASNPASCITNPSGCLSAFDVARVCAIDRRA
jgi:hypothetical protein